MLLPVGSDRRKCFFFRAIHGYYGIQPRQRKYVLHRWSKRTQQNRTSPSRTCRMCSKQAAEEGRVYERNVLHVQNHCRRNRAVVSQVSPDAVCFLTSQELPSQGKDQRAVQEFSPNLLMTLFRKHSRPQRMMFLYRSRNYEKVILSTVCYQRSVTKS